MRRFLAIVMLGVLASCSSGGATARTTGGTGDSGAGGVGILPTGAGGTSPIALSGMITSSVGNPIVVTGSPTMVTFPLTNSGVPASSVTWSVDNPSIGTIDANGVLHLGGTVGGVIVVTASSGGRNISITVTVNVDIVQTGTVSPGDQTTLRTGGAGDATFRWLYPYDQTVFPRGLTAPVLQFGGTAATATYLKITTAHFSYQGYAASTASPLQVTIPPNIWTGVTLTAGATDAVQLSVSKLSGGQASGPATESWRVAQDSLKGVIYYSTYRRRRASAHPPRPASRSGAADAEVLGLP